MRNKFYVILLIGFLWLIACDRTSSTNAGQTAPNKDLTGQKREQPGDPADEKQLSKITGEQPQNNPAGSQTKEPKTVMDFFALLPEKYFTLEGCFRDDDKDCRKARGLYIKTFAEVTDIKNGYFKGGCDGGQSCIEMAIFKRPDDTYVVAVATSSEETEENYFLDYKNGVWTDISEKIVPEFSKDKRYEIPRYGTTVSVFSTKLIEKGDDYEIREKDKKIYDLEWKDGKFSIKR